MTTKRIEPSPYWSKRRGDYSAALSAAQDCSAALVTGEGFVAAVTALLKLLPSAWLWDPQQGKQRLHYRDPLGRLLPQRVAHEEWRRFSRRLEAAA